MISNKLGFFLDDVFLILQSQKSHYTLSSVAVHLPFFIEVYFTASLIGNCSTLASNFVNNALAMNLLFKAIGSTDELVVVLTIFIAVFLIVEIMIYLSPARFLSMNLCIYLSICTYTQTKGRCILSRAFRNVSFLQVFTIYSPWTLTFEKQTKECDLDMPSR